MATKPGDPFERADRRKKLIEMERRHIREGEARVARQEAIVRHFDSSGAPEYALTARALLVTFREFLAIAKQHLDDLEREQPDKPLEQTMPRQRSEGQLAIDSYVGSRVRLRRTLLGISLKKFAEAVGVTARQIRKYERGSDGISASKLYAIATALDVRESFFFENPSPASCKGPVAGADAVLSQERFALMRAYYAIPDPALRHALCEVFKSTARAMTGAASDDETPS